jgi:hypothetical protein
MPPQRPPQPSDDDRYIPHQPIPLTSNASFASSTSSDSTSASDSSSLVSPFEQLHLQDPPLISDVPKDSPDEQHLYQHIEEIDPDVNMLERSRVSTPGSELSSYTCDQRGADAASAVYRSECHGLLARQETPSLASSTRARVACPICSCSSRSTPALATAFKQPPSIMGGGGVPCGICRGRLSTWRRLLLPCLLPVRFFRRSAYL